MPANSIADIVASRLRAIGGVSVLSVAILAATAGVAHAASVTPTPVNSGNPTCAVFDSSWTQLKIDGGLGDGTFSDGTLTVAISNFQNSSSGTSGSFDWSSNIGIDAVFVKAGNDKHNLFVYDPESTGDTDLGPQAGQGNGISHVSFCYDDADDADDPTPPGDDGGTGGDVPPPPPDDGGDEPDTPSTPDQPTPTPGGDVQGVTGTPAPSLPSTDTDAPDGAATASAIQVMLIIVVIVALIGALTIRVPSRFRR